MSRPPIDCVAIGASAGGVEALLELLPALPADFAPSVLIVQHISREGPGRMTELMAPRCRLPVREAADKEPVCGGTVYFAPPDYHLLVDRGPQLALSADDPVMFAQPSIEVLFESAADVFGSRMMGVILAGTNADGSAGLAAIHAAGGVTLVQQCEGYSAVMPQSALSRTPAALAFPISQIAQLFCRLTGGMMPGEIL